MEAIDESSGENNINVMDISDHPEFPHQINKKAYVLKLVLEKDSPNKYRSRTGFNFHPLPDERIRELRDNYCDTSSVTGTLVVYGVQYTVSSVDPSVYDTASVIENGKMVMQTNLSLNGHLLRDSIYHINGFLDSKKEDNKFMLNDAEIISLPGGATLKNIDVYCMHVPRGIMSA